MKKYLVIVLLCPLYPGYQFIPTPEDWCAINAPNGSQTIAFESCVSIIERLEKQ